MFSYLHRNTRRTAEVWMDGYKRHFFAARGIFREGRYGEYVSNLNYCMFLKDIEINLVCFN